MMTAALHRGRHGAPCLTPATSLLHHRAVEEVTHQPGLAAIAAIQPGALGFSGPLCRLAHTGGNASDSSAKRMTAASARKVAGYSTTHPDPDVDASATRDTVVRLERARAGAVTGGLRRVQ